MTWDPPDGLPPGQFVTPDSQASDRARGTDHALWITDGPVSDAGELWARLLHGHEHTGLWPLLLLTMRPYGAALERQQARGALGELRIEKLARRPWHSGEFEPVPARFVDALPPVSPEHCLRVGAEHLAYETPEGLVDGIDTPLSFEEYAARLSGSNTWWFWWD